MEIRILGPLAVLDDRGDEVPLNGTRLRGLLALLVLHAGHVIAAERITEELWGDAQPRDAGGALQNQVSRLRSALRGAGLGDQIETRAPGYVLTVDRNLIDAWRYEAAVRQGRALLDAGDPERASATLAAALSLWRGEVLADLREPEIGSAERARWAELRRVAVEDRVDADLARGHHAELVAELESMVAEEPLRERRTAQLMTALYRSGRQADALRAYQVTRERLAEELGIEPGVELRRLEAAVLAQDPALDAPARTASTSGGVAAARHRIPTPLTRCIGRAEEVDTVEGLLAGHRLVTVVGPGGAGKTRLAIEIGHRFGERLRHGSVLVELAAVEQERDVVAAVARALGIEEPGRTQGEAVADLLSEQELLVVLDNCEHVLDEVAALVAVLLGRCPTVTVLATSRQGLGLAGESAFLIPPLRPDDAVGLFLERAAAVAAAPADPADLATVTDICARLDGMPLAIELAASRTRVFTVPQLSARLDDRFRVVTGGARGALPRHRTLRAVVDWSYDLLDDDERLVFDRLAAFAASWTLEAAEAVAGGDGVGAEDVADLVDRLVGKSLVTVRRLHGTIRFTMLQTLADYGRERLAERGEIDAVRRRLTEWLLGEAVEAERRSQLMTFAEETGAELDNIRSALAWAEAADPALALELAARLRFFWTYNDALAESWRAVTTGLSAAPDASDEIRVLAMTWAGAVGTAVGEAEVAFGLGAEAVELSRRLGDPVLFGQAACLHAQTLTDRHELEAAGALYDEARQQLDAAGALFWLAYLDVRTSIHAAYTGDLQQSYDLSRRAVERFRAAGDRGGVYFALERMGEAAELVGLLDEASAALEEVLRDHHGRGVARRSLLLSRLARVRAAQLRGEDALRLADEAATMASLQSWPLIVGFAAHARGRALVQLGRTDDAIAEMETAIALMRSIRNDAIVMLFAADLEAITASHP